jgi:hypothetical protein
MRKKKRTGKVTMPIYWTRLKNFINPKSTLEISKKYPKDQKNEERTRSKKYVRNLVFGRDRKG